MLGTYLNGHNTSVHDLTINDDRNHLISLGTDKVVKIWDIRTYKCIQTIFDKICYRPEDRLTCILFDDYTNNILLGSRKINQWQFKTQEEIKTSHEYPVSVALYNTSFESVVSCDDGSFIAVWDIENGKLMSKFGNAHGKGIKITSACFDGSQRRLVSSGSDGSIKIWNFSNGQEISKCETQDIIAANQREVTNLCFVADSNNSSLNMGFILAVGWNKRVYLYPDNKEEEIESTIVLPPKEQEVKHKDDIMSVVYSKLDYLAFTGSHEGRLIAWKLDGLKMKYELHLEDPTCLSDNPAKDAKSVDCLLVLDQHRTLISGTADQYLRFWDTKTGKLRNKVKVGHHPEDALTALATSKNNDVLFSGDTSGCIKKFDLESFDIDNSTSLTSEWFIKAHRAIINNIEVVELENCKEKFIISASDDRNINLHRFDGIFIGQFGQDEEWNIYKTHVFDDVRTRKDVIIKNYGTYAKNEDIEKYIDGTYTLEEEMKEEAEGDQEEDDKMGGLTIKGCAALFKEDFAVSNIKPRRIKPINEEKYFNAISKRQPKYLLKSDERNDFFLEKVGVPRDYYKDIISKIHE